MEQHGDEVHFETEEARGGSTPSIVRWVLGISVLLAIGLLSAIWITGATTRDRYPPPPENAVVESEEAIPGEAAASEAVPGAEEATEAVEAPTG